MITQNKSALATPTRAEAELIMYPVVPNSPALDFESIDVGRLVFHCLNSKLSNSLAKNRVQMRSNVPVGLKRVIGDYAAISHLVTGLADNAIKFSADGGEIEITAENTKNTQDSQDSKNSQDSPDSRDFVDIHFKNYGQTISAEDRKRLFELFKSGTETETDTDFKTGVSEKTCVANLGLALHLCHRVVKMHKGKISCQSDDIGGTVFTVTLPVEQARQK